MKNTLIIVLSFFSFSPLLAQAPDFSTRCTEEMKKLAYLTGDWQGEALYRGKKIAQTEHIEWKLQGLALAVDGIGKEKNTTTNQDEIAFQAFAVINFDPFEQQFKFKSYVKEGYSTNAYLTILSENHFEWGFDIPNGGKSRYRITLDPIKKTWNEIGEYSRDGNTWMKTIELNLVKQ